MVMSREEAYELSSARLADDKTKYTQCLKKNTLLNMVDRDLLASTFSKESKLYIDFTRTPYHAYSEYMLWLEERLRKEGYFVRNEIVYLALTW